MSNVSQRPDDSYFEELMGAAAFGHLDGSEQTAFEAWLADNRNGQEEFAQLQAAVELLPLSVDDATPGAGLRDRIAAAVGAGSADTAAPVVTEPISIDAARNRKTSFLMSPAGRMLAAAAVLAIVIVGVFAVIQSITGETTETIGIAEAPEGFEGTLDYVVDDRRLEFKVDSMPAAPEGQVYQLWLIRGDQPISQGIMTGTDVEIEASRSEYDAFAITVEPGPDGSEAPTSEPILVAPLARSDEGADV